MAKEKVLIIGAGLCGTMLAIRMAQKGYKVELFEKRPDIRTVELSAGRSINLALSNRGLKALDMVGLKDKVLEYCIPMKGRLIHFPGGEKRLSPYSGRPDDYINSVSRPGLNGILLDKAEEYENITFHFNCECTSVDLKQGIVYLRDEIREAFSEQGDLIFGTDGAGSLVRKSMMAKTSALLFSYSQDFLQHGYKELSILPNEDGSFKMEKNALHIWPRGSFMVIALPNLDGSFTVTMFHPVKGEEGFLALNSKQKVHSFFDKYYPELLALMPHLTDEYFENPMGTLGTIKCDPWQAYGKCLIMGDAAHAVVPFYGQGMNCSFEDVLVFDRVLDKHDGDWSRTFEQYEKVRKIDADAIADLAVENFVEMRDHVANPVFIKKRKLEMKLESNYPTYFSKYSLVTFREDLPYSLAMKKGRAQDQFLLDLCESDRDIPLDQLLVEISQVSY